MNNYTKISEKYIEEIDAKFTTYMHNKTKARVATIECDDDNKVFSIAFRTPPIDNTGLTHILEHSVLCGSKKYPIKDPFVELLKSSLNTFLNAMTYADKTVYPVASKNLKDFKNLMDVYLDAVFHPNIYNHKEIFEQEGWHYHLENIDDEITYNGVVYNEMKGAFSDPEETLARIIKKTLFPDTAYGYESGGEPKHIPDLTYESFLNFHSKYYSATNSYIYIYGDCDMEERLEYLDKEYLSKMDYVEFDTSLKEQLPFKLPKYKTDYYSSDDGKTFLSYNLALPHNLDTKQLIAFDILISNLFTVTGAQIKEAIIKSGIGDDVDVTFDTEMYQPILGIVVMGAKESDEERLIELIDDEISKIIKKGFDKNGILSIINHEEFIAREKPFSPRAPKGLMIELDSLASWLYDDNNSYGKLETIKYYKELKEDLNNNYFEKLAQKYIISNKHKCYVKLNPIKDYDLKEKEEVSKKLSNYKKKLTDDELNNLILETKNLSIYQSTDDSKEDLAKLPKLTIDDIDKLPEKYELEVIEDKYKILYSDYHTNDISYIKYYFDLSNINVNDYNYLNLYTSLLLKLNTTKHTYYELNEMVRNNLGTLSFGLVNYKDSNNNVCIKLNMSGSVLDEKMNCFYDLLNEVIYNTNFDDKNRIYEVISELRSNIENAVSGRGSIIALTRAQSTYDYQAYLSDLSGGIGYIDFIRYVYDNFDKIKDELINKMKNYHKLFAKNNFMAGYTGKALNDFKKYTNTFYCGLYSISEYEKMEFVPKYQNEAISTPFNVNFVARSGKFSDKYNGYFGVLQTLLSMDYLWDRIRVHGGAYGASIRISPDSNIAYASYRDPNIDSTNLAYDNIVEFIEGLELNDDDLLKYKIGTIGNNQVVLHNKDKAEFARTMYIKNITYEDRKKLREEMLNASVDDVKKLSCCFKEALNPSSICVIGAKDKLKDSKIDYDVKRNL